MNLFECANKEQLKTEIKLQQKIKSCKIEMLQKMGKFDEAFEFWKQKELKD